MLTKEDFFKRKIFFKEGVPALRKKYPNQVQSINLWYMNAEYVKIQDQKSFFEQKLKAALDIDGEAIQVTDQFIFDLYTWWSNVDAVCHYCGISESVLSQLHEQPRHINKRWPQRGQSLELDRKQSDLPYTRIDNLALACYWCNNAKTDTFTYEEFRLIGRAINSIWILRLNQNFPIPEI